MWQVGSGGGQKVRRAVRVGDAASSPRRTRRTPAQRWGSSPSSGNDAFRVACTERSSQSPGRTRRTSPGTPGRRPSVMVSGAGQPTSSRTWSRHCLRRRCRRVERAPADDRQQVGPGPGHDVGDRVPAAAGRDPPPAGDLVRQVGSARYDARCPSTREHQVGQRVVAVGVAAVLGDQHGRARTPAAACGHDRVERAQPAGVVGARRQRHVDGAAGGAGPAGLGRRRRCPGRASAASRAG